MNRSGFCSALIVRDLAIGGIILTRTGLKKVVGELSASLHAVDKREVYDVEVDIRSPSVDNDTAFIVVDVRDNEGNELNTFSFLIKAEYILKSEG